MTAAWPPIQSAITVGVTANETTVTVLRHIGIERDTRCCPLQIRAGSTTTSCHGCRASAWATTSIVTILTTIEVMSQCRRFDLIGDDLGGDRDEAVRPVGLRVKRHDADDCAPVRLGPVSRRC